MVRIVASSDRFTAASSGVTEAADAKVNVKRLKLQLLHGLFKTF